MTLTNRVLWAVALAALVAIPAEAEDAAAASDPEAATGADASASGETAAATETASGPMWVISCSNQAQPEVLACEFSQSIILTNQNGQSQRVATASFQRAAGQKETTALFTLPYEVLLTSPVQVAVDKAEMGSLAWQSCDAQGCYASGPVGEGWLEAMRKGAALTADVTARNGQAITFTFQLKDFRATEGVLP